MIVIFVSIRYKKSLRTIFKAIEIEKKVLIQENRSKNHSEWQFQHNFKKQQINFESNHCKLIVTVLALTMNRFTSVSVPHGIKKKLNALNFGGWGCYVRAYKYKIWHGCYLLIYANIDRSEDINHF